MTTRLIAGLIFLLAWIGFSGSVTLPNIIFGLLMALIGMALMSGDRHPVSRIRPLALARLLGLFVIELLKSGWRVLKIVSRRKVELRPAIIAYPLKVTGDIEITLLANLITLTPGTMSVDVSPDRRLLFVHCVDADDREAVIADIAGGFEARILETFG